LQVTRENDQPRMRALHGVTRAMLANHVTGVTQGFRKELELQGIGYRVQVSGKDLKFQLGFSHDIVFKAVEGTSFKVDGQTKVLVEGIDRQKVGQVAANMRDLRPAEPYKGKGVRYVGEVVRRKEGKTGKK
jgi:large subunit ribosomal protein L6